MLVKVQELCAAQIKSGGINFGKLACAAGAGFCIGFIFGAIESKLKSVSPLISEYLGNFISNFGIRKGTAINIA